MEKSTNIPEYYWCINKDQWSKFQRNTQLHLGANDIDKISGLSDPIDMQEVDSIYRPLVALLQINYAAHQHFLRQQNAFLKENSEFSRSFDSQNIKSTPYVIAIAGSVAVGKSSVARLLHTMLKQLPSKPKVDLVTTDGFLYPNKVLIEKNILNKKGFPISYNTKALLQFLKDVKSAKNNLHIPKYSHVEYDILENEYQEINSPNILILEGLNVLQPPSLESSLAVSDFFDFSIYIDADEKDIENWYIERFLKLKESAFQNEKSYFKNYANLSREEAIAKAQSIWHNINLPNLHENIIDTRNRAKLIIHKGTDHKVEKIWLRKP